MSKNLNVLFASLKMALATFFSRILGLVREQVIAFYFGASGFTDAFLVAYRIPNLLRDLFAEGAFSAAFVPTFVEANLRDSESAKKLLWSLFILLGCTTLALSGLTFIFAPELIHLFAPTFYETPEKFELTVTLTRIMSPFLYLVSMAALFMGALNSLKIFFIPSLAPAFFNVTMIISILTLPGLFISKGLNPILAVGTGVLLGGFVQAFVQIPLIIKHGYGPRKTGPLLNADTRHIMKKLGPGLLGFAATQVNLIVNTILASSTVVGAVSWLSFAFRLFQLPVGILSVSIGNSNLVHFSNSWKENKKDEAQDYLASSYFLSLFLVMPAMVALYTCSDEMINIIFERGKFSAASTSNTALALRWYALGLPFYSLYKIFVPTFYAIDREKIPVYCSILGIAFNIIFSVLLVPRYGFQVLAIGTTVSMLINCGLQGAILGKDLKYDFRFYFNGRLVKILLASISCYGAVSFAQGYFVFREYEFLGRGILLVSYLAIIALCYFSVSFLLGERELIKDILGKIMRKNS